MLDHSGTWGAGSMYPRCNSSRRRSPNRPGISQVMDPQDDGSGTDVLQGYWFIRDGDRVGATLALIGLRLIFTIGLAF